MATTSDERLLSGLMEVTVFGRDAAEAEEGFVGVAVGGGGGDGRPNAAARPRGATWQAQRGARALSHEAVDGQSARRLQPPNGSRSQWPEATVDAGRADVVTTSLQRTLDLTDLNAGLRAHAGVLREHRRAGPAGSVGPARDHHGRDKDCRNGGDEARPDCQGGHFDSHEISLLKRL